MTTYIDENREQRCVHCDEFSQECVCEPTYRIAYDTKNKKVGCVLMAAIVEFGSTRTRSWRSSRDRH